MSLTLVELAQAIEDGKTIEKANEFGVYEDFEPLTRIYRDVRGALRLLRIKPEPKEHWFVAGMDGRHNTLSDALAVRESCTVKDRSIYHVREVL